jgi:hypothetical protein
MRLPPQILYLLLSGLALYSTPSTATWSLTEGAGVHPSYQGTVPSKSDVIFSTRFKRPDSAETARAFGATRVEWVYTKETNFVKEMKGAAPWFGGAINANGPLPNDDGMARDFDGAVLTPPWMKAWSAKWVTTTHPDTQRVIADQIALALSMGADSIQVDDANYQYHGALYHGGDFNPSTLAGFKAYLPAYPDQAKLKALGLVDFEGTYRDYLKARFGIKDAADYKRRYRSLPSTQVWLAYIRSTVDQHYARIRHAANAGRTRPVPFSINLLTLTAPDEASVLFHLVPYADYSMPEVNITDYATVVSMGATARALRLGWAPSILPLSLSENRAAIANLYAMGGQPLVPWDVYNGNDDKGMPNRYFGKPQEYGDLYRFVRSNADLFNGKELAAEVGIVVPVNRFVADKTKALLHALIDRQIPFAFVPVGDSSRRYVVEPERLRHYKVLLTVNPDSDFDTRDLKALADSRVERRSAAEANSALLDALRPFVVAPGGERVHLYPRAAPGDRSRLVVHVVDEARAAPAAPDAGCRRRIGIRAFAVDPKAVRSAHWVTGEARSAVTPEISQDGTYFTLPGCPLWGVLDLVLAQ